MKFEPRWYQEEAKDAILKDIVDSNPIIAVPTGAGKTVIMGSFIYEFIKLYPIANILVVANVKEILEQNYKALQEFFPNIKIGLYSSGLDSKTVEKITVAGIQSIYKKPELFKQFQVIFIDEVHTVPFDAKSMYLQFFNKVPAARYIGMSATVFRRGIGYLHTDEKSIFNKLSYDLTDMENFNRLVREGYLCKLVSKPTGFQLSTEGVKTTAGDFNTKQLSNKNNRLEITKEAIKEALEFGKNYKSWLVFAIDIDHAENINRELNAQGIKSRALHTKNNSDRDEIIQEFKQKKIRAIVSVGMITTGFDAPNIDLIVLLRPTKSAVLHVQMIGRGLRVCEGKTHCLVLDFANNVNRLGPINNVQIPKKKGDKGSGSEPPVKECPQCGCHQHTVVKICDVCGYEFQFKEKITSVSAQVDIIQQEDDKVWFDVRDVHYHRHKKQGRPDCVKVVYLHGLGSFNEYVCIEHGGYAQKVAENWIAQRQTDRWIKTVDSFLKHSSSLKKPRRIFVNLSSKFPSIEDFEF